MADSGTHGVFAGTEVQPMVRGFLIGGGFPVVLFSLLFPARILRIQRVVTAIIAGRAARVATPGAGAGYHAPGLLTFF